MTLVEKAKHQGAILGLEAELNVRINTLKNAQEKRNYTLVYSCSVAIGELAEELRKLMDIKYEKATTGKDEIVGTVGLETEFV